VKNVIRTRQTYYTSIFVQNKHNFSIGNYVGERQDKAREEQYGQYKEQHNKDEENKEETTRNNRIRKKRTRNSRPRK
jgi:hypothetical protein